MADQSHQGPVRDWPEMQKADVSGTAAYTRAMVERENRENKRPLILRSGALQALVALQLYAAGVVLWELLASALHHGQYDALAMAPSDVNAVCQLASCGYFLVGKKPAFGAQVVAALFVLNLIEISLSLPVLYAGNLLLTLLEIALLYFAHRKLESLCKHWF